MKIHEGSWKKNRVSRINDADFAKHLFDHNLDVFIVDFNTLVTVNTLNFLQNVVLHATNPFNTKHFFRIDRTIGQFIASFNLLTLNDTNTRTIADWVDFGFCSTL